MLTVVSKLIRALHIPTVADLERDYLNAAANAYDLETRQREIDNGRFRRALNGFH